MTNVRVQNRLRFALAGGVLAGGTLASSAGAIAASNSGSPQIEFAFNCNATGAALCAPEYFGIRYVVVLDAGGVADIAGAFSKHHRGESGAGAQPLRGPGTWWASVGADGLAVVSDPNGLYFNVDLGVGPLSFPQTAGHYAVRTEPGITVEVQVLD